MFHEGRMRKHFCKDIGSHIIGVTVGESDCSSVDMLSNEMILDVDMLRSCLISGIVS